VFGWAPGCAAPPPAPGLAPETTGAVVPFEIWLEGGHELDGQVLGTLVRLRSTDPGCPLLGFELDVFDDDGDGRFDASESRTWAAMNHVTPTREASLQLARIPGNLVRPHLRALVRTTCGEHEVIRRLER
jgi:hypothetical protein